MEVKSIKSTSTENIFILTYIDRMFHEFRLQLAYGDLTPIVTVEYPFSSYRYCCSGSLVLPRDVAEKLAKVLKKEGEKNNGKRE